MTGASREPTPVRALVALATVAAMLGYVGCGGPRDEPKAPVDGLVPKAVVTKEGPPAAVTSSRKLFQNWPTPAAAIVVSGEQLGYLEPCGCAQGQLGGLLRRYDFVEKLRDQQGWPLALIDLGSLIKGPNVARGGPDQTKVKLRAALKALALMKYAGVALSPDDLKVGVDEAVGQFLNLPDDGPKVIAANVVATGLESRVVPSVRAKAGPVTIGITAVVDPDVMKALRDPSIDLLEIKPIEETLPGVLADLEKDTQTQVLLVQGPPALAKALAEKHPGFDVVVQASTSPDPEQNAEELRGGEGLLVNVGQKGKYVGVVGIFDGEGPRYRYQRVMLGNDYDGAAAPMKAVIEDEFRQSLKDERVVENYPKHGYAGGPAGATFVGAEACKNCHPNTFARWALTKHAHAFESLLGDPKPNTQFDAECVTCHTTGFEYTSGWKSAEATAHLKGNQCENCHGPGSRHAAAPDDPAFRSAMHLTAELADKDRLCVRCHDEDNSPEFDFAKYWGQVIHNDLDDYKDPKTHQGVAPAE